MSATSASLDPFGVAAGKSIRRLANRSIHDRAVQLRVADDVEVEFVCECGDLNCREVVSLRLLEFDRLKKPGSVTAHEGGAATDRADDDGNAPW
jgi:hypothetical protein